MSKGVTVKDVNSHEFVVMYAAHLKKQGKIDKPELWELMKTGTFKELAPYNEDWYYIRCGDCPDQAPQRSRWGGRRSMLSVIAQESWRYSWEQAGSAAGWNRFL